MSVSVDGRNREMATLYLAGRTLKQIGLAFHMSHNRVSQILQRLGTPRRKRGRQTEEQRWEYSEQLAGQKLMPPSSCHPTRRAWVGTLCRDCYQNRPLPPDPKPVLIRGLTQHAAVTLPVRCPKCHAPPPAWIVRDEYAKCLICGQDAFISSGRIVSLKSVNAMLRSRNMSQAACERSEA